MAQIVLNEPQNLNVLMFSIFTQQQQRSGDSNAYTLTGEGGVKMVFVGEGFSYNGLGFPTAGTATLCNVFNATGDVVATVTGLSLGAKKLAALDSGFKFFDSIGAIEYFGSNGADTLEGGFKHDKFLGRGGDDEIRDSIGDDTLSGGEGNDLLLGSIGHNVADGGSGFDVFVFNASVSGSNPVLKLTLAKSGAQTLFDFGSVRLIDVEGLVGSDEDDRLGGDGGNNLLAGGSGGDDSLIGGGGSDSLDGGSGRDLLDGGKGFDIAGFNEAEKGVTASLAKSGFQNTGGAGQDKYVSIEGLAGSRFDDKLTGDGGDNRLRGSFGDDTLDGGKGRDVIAGGFDDDVLRGGAGNDRLNGSSGFDTLAGGGGKDRYLFDSAVEASGDVLAEALSAGEKIDLSAIDANTADAADQAFIFAGQDQTATLSGIAGELIWFLNSEGEISIIADINGDTAADIILTVQNTQPLVVENFDL